MLEKETRLPSLNILMHHRTQGRGVEAVHICGMREGFQQLGCNVEIVGPPGVTVDPNHVVNAESGHSGSKWGKIARHAPQFVFELMELGYNLVAVPRLYRSCRRLRPALLYERYSLYNAAGIVAGLLTGTPVIIEVNDTAAVDRTRQGKKVQMPWLARWFERAIFRHAAGIATVSTYLREQVLALGVPPERVCLTPNAVRSDWMRDRQSEAADVRKRLGIEGKVIIGFSGSFTKWHRVDMLVEAFSDLVHDMPDLYLLLVGDGAQRGDAEELVARFNLQDRVIFTGKLPHDKMPEYLSAMDIGVMPESNAFGSPVKIYEYMVCGCPPVGPRYGPVEEAIEDGRDGLIFEPRNRSALSRLLRTLAADPSRRSEMGGAARAKIQTQHLWVHNARRVMDLAPLQQGESAFPVTAARTKGTEFDSGS